MKRDMDLIRRLALELSQDGVQFPVVGLPDVADNVFAAHAQWMAEAGLLTAALMPDNRQLARQANIWRLTWAGCEFADQVRSDTLWAKAKESVIKPSASWSFGLLTDWLKDQLLQQIGQG